MILHPGAVIGSDGFGFVTDGGVHHKIPQVGGVIIGDDVEIGANTTVDRATLGNTVIGSGQKLDNQYLGVARFGLADSVGRPAMLWKGVIQWKPKWPHPEYWAMFRMPDSPASSSLYAMCAPYQLCSRQMSGSASGRIGSAYGGT